MKLSIGAISLTSGFTIGDDQIWLDNVACRGNETRLIDCPASPLGTHNCGHIEDAGVSCTVGMNTITRVCSASNEWSNQSPELGSSPLDL